MYLEERVEQLENLSVDHGRQIETVAKGLANLTIVVNQRFDQVNQRFDRVEADIADLKNGQARMEVTLTELQQTQQVILTILQERLK